MDRDKNKIYVVLDNIRSKENVGSIFRTADAAGVNKIFLCGITPTPQKRFKIYGLRFKNRSETDKIAKTALGAEKWVTWEYRAKTWQVLRDLKVKSEKIKVIGLERTKNSRNIFSAKGGPAVRLSSPSKSSGGKYKDKKIALVLGNEVRGLSPKILKYCDDVMHIPMYGKKESLNVAVAFGIAIYALIKNRLGG